MLETKSYIIMFKIIIIGCGYWSKNWIKTIKDSKYGLYGTVDLDPNKKQENIPFWTKIKDVPKEYTHAIICTPASTHLQIYNELKEQGIQDQNILVEKPVGISYEEAYEMKDCFHGFVWLIDPTVKYIKNNIDIIGDILTIKIQRTSMGPRIRDDVSIIEDYLIHDISILLYIFGNNIEILYSKILNNFKFPIKSDSIFVLCKYKNAIIEMFSSWIYCQKTRIINITGSRGSFFWDGDKLFFNASHYNENNNKIDKYGNIGYELIECLNNNIYIDKSKTNLELELDNFINNKKINISIEDIWNMIKKIKK